MFAGVTRLERDVDFLVHFFASDQPQCRINRACALTNESWNTVTS